MMKILESCNCSPSSCMVVQDVSVNQVNIEGVIAKPGDECLLIGLNNDVQNLRLNRIIDTGVDNKSRIYSLEFEGGVEIYASRMMIIGLKFFGVYQ